MNSLLVDVPILATAVSDPAITIPSGSGEVPSTLKSGVQTSGTTWTGETATGRRQYLFSCRLFGRQWHATAKVSCHAWGMGGTRERGAVDSRGCPDCYGTDSIAQHGGSRQKSCGLARTSPSGLASISGHVFASRARIPRKSTWAGLRLSTFGIQIKMTSPWLHPSGPRIMRTNSVASPSNLATVR